MSSRLFTVVCEFKGGTYVSQVQGRDEQQAFTAWLNILRYDQLMGDDSYQIASEAVLDAEALTALAGMVGVWCWTANVNNHFIIANIILCG